MPIFEFKCEKCGLEWTEITRSDAKIECPKCKIEAKKKFSRFNTKPSQVQQ